MSKWQEKTKRPVLPVYIGGAGVAYYGPAGAHLHAGRLVLTAAVSAGAYFAGTKLCLPALCAPTCPMPQAVRTWTPC